MLTRSLNLGILAHVDAGKTTLTERLLHSAGVIDEPGSVDSGTTRTDTLSLERRRGITIKAAVVSFPLGDATVNVLDTPGHPDFIAEVERVLGVLDGAILVLSAVEGVQPQTRILMRALQRLAVPTLLFVNKIDRTGADADSVLEAVRRRLTPDVLPMGRVSGAGTPAATFQGFPPDDLDFGERQTAALAEHDDAILASYLETGTSPRRLLQAGLAGQTRAGWLHPAYAGSAATGAGVSELMSGIASLLPAMPTKKSEATDDGEPSGRVFKIERTGAGQKSAYVRMFSGSLTARSRLHLSQGRTGKVNGLQLFTDGRWVRTDRVGSGQIGRLTGLSSVRVGDDFGRTDTAEYHFAPPTLEATVVAIDPAQEPAMRAALTELSDADPLIAARIDDNGQAVVSLYGVVQQEVIAATLADEYGIEVAFSDASVLHVERPRTVGSAVERLNTETNPYHATIGLTISPGPPGSGLRFVTAAPARDMPLYLYKNANAFSAAIQRHVTAALTSGLHGWAVTDCIVTLTHSGYSVADGPPSRRGPTSTSVDYRQLAPIVLRQALHRAGTQVCEPVLRVALEVPNDAVTAVQRLVTRWGAVVLSQTTGEDLSQIEIRLLSTRLHQLQIQLPDLTGGEGTLESRFDGFEPVNGPAPRRFSSDRRPATGLALSPPRGAVADGRDR